MMNTTPTTESTETKKSPSEMKEKKGDEVSAAAGLLGLDTADDSRPSNSPNAAAATRTSSKDGTSTSSKKEEQHTKQEKEEENKKPAAESDFKTSMPTTTDSPTKIFSIPPKRPQARRKKKHFSSTLFAIIDDENNADICHWVHDGTAFIIADKTRFENEILPRYFKKAQFSSFTRKLSRWGFLRIARGKSIGAYYHKHFLKNAPDLCRLMTCTGTNGNNQESYEIPGGNVLASSSGMPVPSLSLYQGDQHQQQHLSLQDILPRTSPPFGGVIPPGAQGGSIVPPTRNDDLINSFLQSPYEGAGLKPEDPHERLFHLRRLRAIQEQQARQQQQQQEMLRLRELEYIHAEIRKQELERVNRARTELLLQQVQEEERQRLLTRSLMMQQHHANTSTAAMAVDPASEQQQQQQSRLREEVLLADAAARDNHNALPSTSLSPKNFQQQMEGKYGSRNSHKSSGPSRAWAA